jgi:mono/diheme cytochrome c family protein
MSSPEQPPPASAPISRLNQREDLDERTDVIRLHAAVLREQSEPREGLEPLSVWLAGLMGALLFWGGFYLQRYSGGYKPQEYDENSSGAAPVVAAPAVVDIRVQGKRVFSDICGKCHQENGEGLPGRYPSLVGSDWILAGGPARIIRIALDGLKGPVHVKGEVFNAANDPGITMVPWRANLSDQDIAAALTYIRSQKDWGNNASEVKPEQVAAIRKKTEAHADAGGWTEAELLKIPDNEP